MSLLERTGASTIKVKSTLLLAHLFRTKAKRGSDCSLPTELCEAVAAPRCCSASFSTLPPGGGRLQSPMLFSLLWHASSSAYCEAEATHWSDSYGNYAQDSRHVSSNRKNRSYLAWTQPGRVWRWIRPDLGWLILVACLVEARPGMVACLVGAGIC